MLRRAAPRRNLLLVDVDAEDANIGRVLRAQHPDLPVPRRLPDGLRGLDDLDLLRGAGSPDAAPLLPRPEAIVVLDGAAAPPGARVLRVAGVADLRVVRDEVVTTDARSGKLFATELFQPVLLGAHPAQEDASLFAHARLLG